MALVSHTNLNGGYASLDQYFPNPDIVRVSVTFNWPFGQHTFGSHNLLL